jgi:UDP-glucose 4-epimerase
MASLGRGQTAVVTGGAGFIGSHLVDALLGDGLAVVVLDDLSTGSADNVPAEATLEVLDITNRSALDRAMDAAKPSVLFHLGAQSSVTVSISDPERDCDVNVHGTLNVLEAAKRHQAPVVFTSTGGALYGDAAPIPTPEEQMPAPISPYGASKWAGEAYVNTWREAGGPAHSICRLGNVYGPRQSPHGEAGVVAIFSHRLWSGRTPKLYGYGKPTRDYIHVADVAAALIASTGEGSTFNIATGTETPVATIFSLLQQVSGASGEPELCPLRPGELKRSCISPDHARNVLGWSAARSLEEGLAETYRALVEEFDSEGTMGR